MKRTNLILLALALLLSIAPLLLGGAAPEFSGADGQAMAAAVAIQPDYQPWFRFGWKPPAEIESLLFALQAAFGAGVLGYYLGFRRGQARSRARQPDRVDAGD